MALMSIFTLVLVLLATSINYEIIHHYADIQ
jgi:hypothetical protein